MKGAVAAPAASCWRKERRVSGMAVWISEGGVFAQVRQVRIVGRFRKSLSFRPERSGVEKPLTFLRARWRGART